MEQPMPRTCEMKAALMLRAGLAIVGILGWRTATIGQGDCGQYWLIEIASSLSVVIQPATININVLLTYIIQAEESQATHFIINVRFEIWSRFPNRIPGR